MWAGGDLAFLLALVLAVWVWLRAEEIEGRRADDRLDRAAARSARNADRAASRTAPASTNSATRTPPADSYAARD